MLKLKSTHFPVCQSEAFYSVCWHSFSWLIVCTWVMVILWILQNQKKIAYFLKYCVNVLLLGSHSNCKTCLILSWEYTFYKSFGLGWNIGWIFNETIHPFSTLFWQQSGLNWKRTASISQKSFWLKETSLRDETFWPIAEMWYFWHTGLTIVQSGLQYYFSKVCNKEFFRKDFGMGWIIGWIFKRIIHPFFTLF